MESQASSRRCLVAEIGFDRTVHLDGQRVAEAVLGIARGDADPALADAVFLDIGLFDALEANADVARQNLFIVIRAAWVDREAVGKLVAHGFARFVQSRFSMSLRIASGVAVGA